MFKGITLEEFHKYFNSEKKCRQYLFAIKWRDGFKCKSCGHTEYWSGRTKFHARCKKCEYDESITAHTVFHKIQIPLLKAFSMVFHIVAFKKGISTMELAKVFNISQKSAWNFKRKIQESMTASLLMDNDLNLIGKITKLDGVIISHRSKNKNGLQSVNLTIQKMRKFPNHVESVRCKGYFKEDEIDPCHLVGGRYVDVGKDIQLWNFKSWLTGIHHHCSEKYFSGYLDEYFFRVKFRHRQIMVWHSIIDLIVRTKPNHLTVNAA